MYRNCRSQCYPLQYRLASIPNSCGAIVGTGGDVLAIRGPAHTHYAMKTLPVPTLGMFFIGKDMVSCEAVPELYRDIIGGGGNVLAIRRPGQVIDRPRTPFISDDGTQRRLRACFINAS